MSTNVHIVDRHNGVAIQKVCAGRYQLLDDQTKKLHSVEGKIFVNIPTLQQARTLAGKPAN